METVPREGPLDHISAMGFDLYILHTAALRPWPIRRLVLDFLDTWVAGGLGLGGLGLGGLGLGLGLGLPQAPQSPCASAFLRRVACRQW
jgi:hypothetical protein